MLTPITLLNDCAASARLFRILILGLLSHFGRRLPQRKWTILAVFVVITSVAVPTQYGRRLAALNPVSQ